ncbi:tetratricopeptide repeat protein [Candidatus Sumerlaeota bacterium]|nr:tetratricopeptide repeat protein [Candidatus Sumerlaeota bacterium]
MIETVNSSLDARAVLGELGVREDKMSSVGGRLKCYCPVHRGELFKSLQIDSVRRTCQCIISDCTAHNQMSLVGLYALLRKEGELAAALDLAQIFKVELPAAQLREIVQQHITAANAAEQERDYRGCADNLAVAFFAEPQNIAFAERLASMRDRAGDERGAAEAFLYASRLARTRGDLKKASTLLEQKAAVLDPENRLILMELMDLQRERDPNDAKWARTLFLHARVAADRDRQFDTALDNLEQVATKLTDDPAVLMQMAEVLQKLGRTGESMEKLYHAALCHARERNEQVALAILEEILEHEPGRTDARRLAAEIRARNGDLETFRREMEALAREAMDAGDEEAATTYCNMLIETVPGNLFATDMLATIYGKRGDVPRQIEMLFYAADIAGAREEYDQAIEYLERVRPLPSKSTPNIERLGQSYAQLGRVDLASEQLLDAVTGYLAEGKADRAKACCAKMLAVSPVDVERNQQVAAHLSEAKLVTESTEHLLQLVKALHGEERFDESRPVIEDLRAAEVESADLDKLEWESALHGQDEELMVDWSLRLARRACDADQIAEAESILERALEVCPSNGDLQELMVAVLRAAGREGESAPLLASIAQSMSLPLERRLSAAEAALKLDYKNGPLLTAYGAALEENGDPSAACAAYRQAVEEYIGTGSFQEAHHALERALNIAPEENELVEMQADLALRQKDLDRAEQLYISYLQRMAVLHDESEVRASFDRVMEKFPAQMNIHRACAEWLESIGDRQGAVEKYLYIADHFQVMEQWTEALEVVDRLLAIRSDVYLALVTRAELLQKLGRDEDALDALRVAGECAITEGNPREVIRCFDEIARTQPLTEDQQLAVALAHQKQGNAEKSLPYLLQMLERKTEAADQQAIIDISKAILEIDPARHDVHQGYADLLRMRGDFEGAAAQYLDLGSKHFDSGEKDKAWHYLHLAKDLDPKATGTREQIIKLLEEREDHEGARTEKLELAAIYTDANNAGAAIDLLKPLIEVRPDDEVVLERMGAAQTAVGANDAARETLLHAAGLYETAGKFAEAVAVLRRIMDVAPSDLSIAQHLAALLRRDLRPDEALDVYIGLLNTVINNGREDLVDHLLSEMLHVWEGDWDRFVRVIDVLRSRALDDDATASAESFMERSDMLEQPSQALMACQYLLRHDQGSATLREAEACYLSATGEKDSAARNFDLLLDEVEQKGDAEEFLRLARVACETIPGNELLTKRLVQALLDVKDVRSNIPELLAAVRSYRNEGKLRDAKALLERLARTFEDEADLSFELAELYVAEGNTADATKTLRYLAERAQDEQPELTRRAYDKLIQLTPDAVRDMENYARFLVKQDGVDGALTLIAKILELHCDQKSSAKTFRKKCLPIMEIANGDERVRRIYADQLNKKGDPEGAAEELVAIARAAIERQDHKTALATAREARTHHESAAVLALELECAEKIGDKDEIVHALNALASLLRKQGQGDDLYKTLEKLSAINSSDPTPLEEMIQLLGADPDRKKARRIHRQLADAYKASDLHELQIDALEKLAAFDSDDASVVKELCGALVTANRHAEAAAHWLEFARHEESKDRHETALEAAEQALKLDAGLDEARAVVMELKWNLKRVDDYAGDAARFTGLLMAADERERAVAQLSSSVTRLMNAKEFAASTRLLSGFASLTVADSGLLKSKALALEGEGKEREAVDVWATLADRLTHDGATEEAEKVLRRLIAIDPRNIAVRERLITSLRDGGESRRHELIVELEELAAAAESSGDPDRTARTYDELLAVDPQNLVALEKLSSICASRGDREGAGALLLRIGNVHRSLGNTEEAFASYQESLRNAPENQAARREVIAAAKTLGSRDVFREESLRLANALESSEAHGEALEVYEALIHDDADQVDVLERIASIHAMLGNKEKQHAALKLLFGSHVKGDRLHEARACVQRIQELGLSDSELQELLGDLFARSGDQAEATRCLASAAQEYSRAGDFERALGVVDRGIKATPTSKSARRLRADLLLQTERVADAADELVTLASLQQADSEVEAELETLREAATWYPQNLLAVERLAFLLSDFDEPEESFTQFMVLADEKEKRSDKDGAIEALRTAAMQQPDRMEPHRELARLYHDKGDSQHAWTSLLWLADFYEKTNNQDDLTVTLEKLLEYSRDKKVLRRYAAQKLKAGAHDDAAKLFTELLGDALDEGDDDAAGDAVRSLRDTGVLLTPEMLPRIASFYLKTNKQSEAREIYLTTFAQLVEKGEIDAAQQLIPAVAELEGNQTDWRRRVADVYIKNGIPELAAKELVEVGQILERAQRLEQALEVSDQALVYTPDSLPALELRFRVLTSLANIPEAIDCGQRLLKQAEDRGQHEFCVSVAKQLTVLQPSDDLSRLALVRYLRATQQYLQLAEELRGLSDLYMRKQDPKRASETLKSLLQIVPDDTRARQQYIETYRQVGPEKDLILDYAKLADIHARKGAVQDATIAYEKILHIDPNHLELRDKFIEFLMANGQPQRAVAETYQLVDLALAAGQARKAQRALERITRHVGEDADFHYLLGRVYRDLNARGMAAKQFETAADLYQHSNNLGKQIEVLRDLLKIDSLNLEVRQRMIDVLVASSQGSEAVREMEDLGLSYLERGLPDLAEAEFRKITTAEPRRISTWKLLIQALEGFAKPEDIAADYVTYAQLLNASGDKAEALRILKKISTVEISDLDLRREYIDIYLQVGRPQDLSEDVVMLAEGLVAAGRIDEAVVYFEKAMAIDPSNSKARELLSATQSRVIAMHGDEDLRHRNGLDSSLDLGSSARIPFVKVTASDYLQGTMSNFDRKDSEEALSQILNNYQDILSVNPQNAAVRLKLADVHEQIGQISSMLHQLALASEVFFNKNELSPCIAACERFLRVNPSDQRVRKRMNDAILKRDAYKAIESALLYPDMPDGAPKKKS